MKENRNVVLMVHPYAPYDNMYGASGLSFFKRLEYRKNCMEFLRDAKDLDVLIFHFRDVYSGEPPLQKKFGTKADLEIPTFHTSGQPIVLPIRPDEKFNVYVCGAYAGACVKTATEAFSGHTNTLNLVTDCIVPKYDNLLTSEYQRTVKLGAFSHLNPREMSHTNISI